MLDLYMKMLHCQCFMCSPNPKRDNINDTFSSYRYYKDYETKTIMYILKHFVERIEVYSALHVFFSLIMALEQFFPFLVNFFDFLWIIYTFLFDSYIRYSFLHVCLLLH